MEHKKFFEKNGYVLINNFFSEEEAKLICSYADELDSWKEEKGKWMIYFEKTSSDEKRKARIENFLSYHEGVKKLYTEVIYPKLETLTGHKLSLLKEKLNFKKGYAKGFKAHQDHPAWTDFESSLYISVAMFANNSTILNGCLEFAHGNRYKNVLLNNKENLGEIKKEIEELLNWGYVETTPRDLVIFDSFVPHRSGHNRTFEERRIFYFTHNLESYGNYYDDYIVNKRKNFPPDIERDGDIDIKNNKYNLANPIV